MESATPDQQWSNIPQDILTQIFKYLPVAPDRWHCLFVSKAFHSAMQSRLLWTHITLQDCRVMPKKRGWDELERQKPKKLEFVTAAFLGYLKKNHRDIVVELDLSHAAMESEGEYLPRKFNIQYNPEYNDDHMNVFWSLMFDFPNLRNLSLFGAFFTSGSQSSFSAPVNKSLRSSVRNLNLLKENIFYQSRDTLKTILEYAPELEVLQIQDISEDSNALTEKHHKLKHLLLVLCTASPVNVAEYCPNLEVFVNHKYDHHWGEPEAPPKLPRDNIIFISGERKPLRDLSPDDITQRISKAIVNTRYATNAGFPQLHDLVKNDNEKLLELSLSVLKLDPNIKFRTAPDVVLDPFVLLYPYDSQSDNRGWADEVTENTVPPLLEAGDTPLHYAVKRKKIGMVQILLENGANPNAQNSAYRTPLCYVHSMGMLNILLNRGASLDIVDKDGWNLLMNFVANKTRLYPQAEEIQDHFSFNSSSIAPEDSDRLKLFQHLVGLGCDVNYHAPNGLNALKIALSVNDQPVVEYLLKHMKEPLVEKSPCVGLLSCVAATSSPDLQMIEKLLKMGADPAIVDERGQTYLHVAAERNQLQLLASVEHIKDRTKLLSLTDSAGFTFLHYAVLPPTTEVIWECDIQHEYLQFLSKKCKPNMTEQTENLELFLTLVDSDSVINTQAVSGETPLLLACRSMTSIRREDVVRRLLSHGANPNIVDHDGGSPLIAAAYALDDTVVKQLIEAGADVAHCDNKGFNALLAATFAVYKRFMEVKSHNYHQGLREGQRKYMKETDKQGFIKIFNVLLKNKISVNQQEKLCGLSMLHILSSLFESEAVEWITTLVKDHGADINTRTLMNETPLHYSIRHKCVLPAKTLLQLGADVNARGIGMMTPLHYVLDISYGIHNLNNTLLTDDIKIGIDGHKIVANTLIRYPSWMWSSPDDRSQNPTAGYYDSETDYMLMLFMELFRHAADKLDFNAQSYMGNLPLHNCWQLAKSLVDPGNVTQGVVEPKHYLLSIPIVMLKYATREQMLTKNFSENTPFDTMLSSILTMFKPSVMAGTYSSVKEGFDMIFKRCLDLVGDTININHVITTASLDIEYSVVELLVKKAKENGKFSFTEIKPSVQVASSTMLSYIVSDPKLYALFKDFAPLFATYLPREPPKPFQPMIFSLVLSYQNACGYDDKATRPKSLDDLLKLAGIDWKLELSDTKENLLLTAYNWWRNTGAESLLYNIIHNRKNIIEADKLIADLINVGVDPHQKNIIGQSFADMVPQYEKIVENAKYLKGEEKRAIQKESYWTDKKPSMLMELLKAITC